MMIKNYDLVIVIGSKAPLSTNVANPVDKHQVLDQINPLSDPHIVSPKNGFVP